MNSVIYLVCIVTGLMFLGVLIECLLRMADAFTEIARQGFNNMYFAGSVFVLTGVMIWLINVTQTVRMNRQFLFCSLAGVLAAIVIKLLTAPKNTGMQNAMPDQKK